MDLLRLKTRPLNQRRLPWQERHQIFSHLARETAKKNHVEAGGI
jgi:hypothetical protein